jgi:hypothetical protein
VKRANKVRLAAVVDALSDMVNTDLLLLLHRVLRAKSHMLTFPNLLPLVVSSLAHQGMIEMNVNL